MARGFLPRGLSDAYRRPCWTASLRQTLRLRRRPPPPSVGGRHRI